MGDIAEYYQAHKQAKTEKSNLSAKNGSGLAGVMKLLQGQTMGKDDVGILILKAYNEGQKAILDLLTPLERDKVQYILKNGVDKTDYRGKDYVKIKGFEKSISAYIRMRESVEI